MKVKIHPNAIVGRVKNKRLSISEYGKDFKVEFVRLGGNPKTCQSEEFKMGLVATEIALSSEALDHLCELWLNYKWIKQNEAPRK